MASVAPACGLDADRCRPARLYALRCAGACYGGRLVAQDDTQDREEVPEDLCREAAPPHLVACNIKLVTDGHDDSHAATALTTHDPGGALPDRRPSAGAADRKLSQVSSTSDGHNATISVVLDSSHCS